MPNWNHIVREHLAVLRLPPEREIEIVEELALHMEIAYEAALADALSEAEAVARAVRGYDWQLLECELSRAERPPAARTLQPSLELIERNGGIRMGSFIQDLLSFAKSHPILKCLARISCNLARRHYIPFPKLLKLKVNEFWRRTGQRITSLILCPLGSLHEKTATPFPAPASFQSRRRTCRFRSRSAAGSKRKDW
jgi:hypothetical protein